MAPARVLFIEDEMLLRMAIVPELEDAGYLIEEASNGKQALEIFRARPGDFSCAVVDVGLPDMKGDTLVPAFRALVPGFRFILATGYGGAELQKVFGMDPAVRVMGKPYFAADLTAAFVSLGLMAGPVDPPGMRLTPE